MLNIFPLLTRLSIAFSTSVEGKVWLAHVHSAREAIEFKIALNLEYASPCICAQGSDSGAISIFQRAKPTFLQSCFGAKRIEQVQVDDFHLRRDVFRV